MKADSRMVRTTVYLPADLRARLHELAATGYRPDPVGGFLKERAR